MYESLKNKIGKKKGKGWLPSKNYKKRKHGFIKPNVPCIKIGGRKQRRQAPLGTHPALAPSLTLLTTD